MISLKINNIKNFTSHLLVKETFADWGLVECQIITHSTFVINGRTNMEYYSEKEREALIDGSYTAFGKLRPICYEIIKGKSLPTFFKFVFKLDNETTLGIIDALPDFKVSDVAGMFLNVKYDEGSLLVTTGTSMNIFTLDKSIDKAFDNYITQFFENNSIEFSIC